MIFVLLAIWLAVTEFGLIDPLFLPSPIAVITRLVMLLLQGHLLVSLGLTSCRAMLGLAIAMVIGIPTGLLAGFRRSVSDAIVGLVDFLRSIPATALFPLFMLWLGIGEASRIGLVVFGCSLVILINALYGARNSSLARREVALSMGADKKTVFFKVICWDSLPQVMVGVRIGLSLALVLVVVSEMFIGAGPGLGRTIVESHAMYRIPDMYGAILLTGLLGYTLNRAFVSFEKRFVHWVGRTPI